MGRALVRDPKLFLFDEPLSNLDAKLRVDMRTEIKKLHLRVGKTTSALCTHDQIEAMTLASRIAVMHQGAIQQFDEPQAVYDRPANMFVAGFMGSPSMNFIPAELTKLNNAPAVAIALQDGKTATLQLAQPPASRPADGKGLLGVRPEHLFRYSENLKAQKPALAKLTAPVEVVEPTGPRPTQCSRSVSARSSWAVSIPTRRRGSANCCRWESTCRMRALVASPGRNPSFRRRPLDLRELSEPRRPRRLRQRRRNRDRRRHRARLHRHHARVAFCDLEADAGEQLAKELASDPPEGAFSPMRRDRHCGASGGDRAGARGARADRRARQQRRQRRAASCR